MSVVASLLRAIDRADGEALVMHVGDRPYVVTANGHAELAARPLTLQAITGMLEALLTPESRQALEEFGAVEHQLPPSPEDRHFRYTVVAARGGDDIWIEVRRRAETPETEAAVAASPVAEPPAAEPVTVTTTAGAALFESPVAETPAAETAVAEVPAAEIPVADPPRFHAEVPAAPLAEEAWPQVPTVDHQIGYAPPAPVAPQFEVEHFQREESTPAAAEPEAVRADVGSSLPEMTIEVPSLHEPAPLHFEAPQEWPGVDFASALSAEASGTKPDVTADAGADRAHASEPEGPPATLDEAASVAFEEIEAAASEPPAAEPEPEPALASVSASDTEDPFTLRHEVPPDVPAEQEQEDELDVVARDRFTPEFDFAIAGAAAGAGGARAHEDRPPAYGDVVVPLARVSVRLEEPPRPGAHVDPLHHLLKVAAHYGATALYVAPQARPSIRVDGEIRVLQDETALSDTQLEAGLSALRSSAAGGRMVGDLETFDVAEVGRVQYLAFRDHRGQGAVFQVLTARAISAEQMGLGPQIQALCSESEGLLLVAGGRGAGKTTLVASLVDQINRTRRDHIVSVEQQVRFVHENHRSFVSQREASEDSALAEAVRSAMREAPDVLVVDQIRTADVAREALEAAVNGHLVVAAVSATNTAAALRMFTEFFPAEAQAQVRAALAEHLRGVITQVLLRKRGGGRAAAREVLVNAPSVASLIADTQFDQLAQVIGSGRRVGMVPLNDALLGLVQAGALDVREAYRKSPDRDELLGLMGRAGIDTSFAERLV